jgi:hypothetical protein
LSRGLYQHGCHLSGLACAATGEPLVCVSFGPTIRDKQ